MSKTLCIAAAMAVLATAAVAIPSSALAREGARSVGHGIKCYTSTGGQRICFKGP